ncbi:hypothetical protein PMAYCL1PPCAC_21097, partial [Pristionchus mayeri]
SVESTNLQHALLCDFHAPVGKRRLYSYAILTPLDVALFRYRDAVTGQLQHRAVEDLVEGRVALSRTGYQPLLADERHERALRGRDLVL